MSICNTKSTKKTNVKSLLRKYLSLLSRYESARRISCLQLSTSYHEYHRLASVYCMAHYCPHHRFLKTFQSSVTYSELLSTPYKHTRVRHPWHQPGLCVKEPRSVVVGISMAAYQRFTFVGLIRCKLCAKS